MSSTSNDLGTNDIILVFLEPHLYHFPYKSCKNGVIKERKLLGIIT